MLVSRGIVRKSQKNQKFQVGKFCRQISITKSSSVQPGKNAFIDKTISNVIPQVLIPKVPCGHSTAIEIVDLHWFTNFYWWFSIVFCASPGAQDTSQPFEASLDFLVDEVRVRSALTSGRDCATLVLRLFPRKWVLFGRVGCWAPLEKTRRLMELGNLERPHCSPSP